MTIETTTPWLLLGITLTLRPTIFDLRIVSSLPRDSAISMACCVSFTVQLRNSRQVIKDTAHAILLTFTPPLAVTAYLPVVHALEFVQHASLKAIVLSLTNTLHKLHLIICKRKSPASLTGTGQLSQR